MDSGTMRLIEAAQERYGWTDTTLLGVLAGYIANQDADDALAAYLAERGPETYDEDPEINDEEGNEPGRGNAGDPDTAVPGPGKPAPAAAGRPAGVTRTVTDRAARDQEVITDIQDRLGNGRPPVEPGHFEGTSYQDEDDYYDRYEIGEVTGDPASDRGASFTARDGNRAYVITIRRQQ